MQGFPVNLVGAIFENRSKMGQPNGPSELREHRMSSKEYYYYY
jgi:hypothetical protein